MIAEYDNATYEACAVMAEPAIAEPVKSTHRVEVVPVRLERLNMASTNRLSGTTRRRGNWLSNWRFRSMRKTFNPFGQTAREMMRRMLGMVFDPTACKAPSGPGVTVMTHGVNREAKAARRAHRKRVNVQRRHMARLAA